MPPVRIARTDRACAQRGADSGARILSAGLFLARRQLVGTSPSPPRHRYRYRCVRSVLVSLPGVLVRVVLSRRCWVTLPVEVAGSLPWTVPLGTSPHPPIRAGEASASPLAHGSGFGWLSRWHGMWGLGWLGLAWLPAPFLICAGHRAHSCAGGR